MKYWLLSTLVGGMCLVNVCHSWNDVQDYGGTDLRVRVIGARAVVRGLNPYTIRETEDLDPALRDPDQRGLSRCTYPPTLLFLYSPLSALTYPKQRAIWAALEWFAFVGSVFLLGGCLHSKASRYCFCISAIGLVGGSWFWRLHVERGQYYIFIVLLISLGMRLLLTTRHNIVAGCVWGIAVCLRPTSVFFLLPWLLDFRRKTGLAAVVTAIVTAAFATGMGKAEYWQDFLKLSSDWEMSLLGGAVEQTNEVVKEVRPTDGYVTATLPGFASNLTFLTLFASLRSSFDGRLDPVAVSRIGKVVWLIALSLICVLHHRNAKQQFASVEKRLLLGICLMLVTDYFLPIRIEYADVLFLLPMALLTPVLMQKENRFIAVLGIFAMLINAAPLASVPFNVAAVTAIVRSAVVGFILVRFTILPPATMDSAAEPFSE